VIYAFIAEHRHYPVVKWAVFFEVSTSGYYAWRSTRVLREARRENQRAHIRRIFNDSNGTYGADRICGQLRRDGCTAGYRRVKRMMQEEGLHSLHLRYRRSLTDSRKARGAGYPNLLRGRPVVMPFQALSSDISYIPTGEGFEYLCTIRDIVSGVVLAYKMSERMTHTLVLDTITSLQRKWQLPPGTIFHSDRGSQYTATEVMKKIHGLGFRQSFSRVGKPGDNSWSESFFATLKKEAVHGVYFDSRSAARSAMFSFIDAFYNSSRIQKGLGYLAPIPWLFRWANAPLLLTA
jgi:Transposase and inactivated derivatives